VIIVFVKIQFIYYCQRRQSLPCWHRNEFQQASNIEQDQISQMRKIYNIYHHLQLIYNSYKTFNNGYYNFTYLLTYLLTASTSSFCTRWVILQIDRWWHNNAIIADILSRVTYFSFICALNYTDFCNLPPTTEEVNAIARDVCLSVCLLARLLENACIDLDDILRVDRCRDMDELINFWVRSGS